MMKNNPIPYTCDSCAYFIIEDGEPYYCAIKDLYTFVNAEDKACWEFTLNRKFIKR